MVKPETITGLYRLGSTCWHLKTGLNVIWQITVYDISRHGSYDASNLSVKFLLSDGQTDFKDLSNNFGSTVVQKKQ